MNQLRTALVTGASSGFGLLIAESLVKCGFRVFGTSRKQIESRNGVEFIPLDVTSADSITTCVDLLNTKTERIDVLVNNAGVTHASLIEETDLDYARQVFETNFWGTVSLTNAILPGMRSTRQGLIINISSLAGLNGAPGQGFYAASKHALEGYSETLRVELAAFGIYVCLIEPGFFKTNLAHQGATPSSHIRDYDPYRSNVEKAIDIALSTGGDPTEVGNTVINVIQAETPRLRYRVGRDAVWVPKLKVLLPEWIFLRAMGTKFGLKASQ